MTIGWTSYGDGSAGIILAVGNVTLKITDDLPSPVGCHALSAARAPREVA